MNMGNMNMGSTVSGDRAVTISLKDCVVRGEATFIRDNELQSVKVTWMNGLLATNDRLFVAGGDSIQPRRDIRAEFTLRHVTALVDAGLVLLTNSKEAPFQLLTQIRADDCLFAATKNPPLVEQRGSDGVDQYRTRFQWSGDHNYFDGFDTFWQITNAAGPSGSNQLDFDAWTQLWHGSMPAQSAGRDAVAWAAPPGALQPFHTHTPADYALDGASEDEENPAAGGASDRLDAGAVIASLPSVPSRSATPDVPPPDANDEP
jgi:hypothetical protein